MTDLERKLYKALREARRECQRCEYFLDHRDPSSDEEDERTMGYCCHAAADPTGHHAVHAEYGGFWTWEDHTCPVWEPRKARKGNEL